MAEVIQEGPEMRTDQLPSYLEPSNEFLRLDIIRVEVSLLVLVPGFVYF